MDLDPIFDRAQLNLATEQVFHRSDGFTVASDYQIEVTKIGVYIERETVRGDPSGYVYADRGNLSALGVNTRQSLDAKCFDPKIRHGPDQDFFEVAHVAMHVFAIGTEVDDRVANHLAQSVISHFSTAIRFKERNVAEFELILVQQDR
jgi:hypothetical protein